MIALDSRGFGGAMTTGSMSGTTCLSLTKQIGCYLEKCRPDGGMPLIPRMHFQRTGKSDLTPLGVLSF
jgi:hypothetical protein